jgi:outer membrane protein assembly factor BamA
MARLLALAALCAWLSPADAFGQQTRAELLERQRAERARSLTTYAPNPVERGLLYLDEKRILERLGQDLTGIYPRIGGFTTGSGFAMGIGLRAALPGTRDFEIDMSTAFSAKAYKDLDLRLRTPSLLGGWLELDGGTRWWDYTQEDFFGLGESSRVDRTDYRYQAFAANVVARVRLRRWFSFGEEVGYLRPEIDDGTDDRFPATGDYFTDEEAPGLTRQPHLVYTRGFVDVDYRDQPGNPRGGGRVFFQIGTGRDQDPSREFSYRRTDLDVMQVFPIFDKKRAFAVRIAAAHVDPLNADGRVAFFLSPTIGGSRTVRSYRAARFRDATYVLTNVEYRWEAFSGLDLALFWDGGDVGTTIEQIRLKEFKTGYGFGLRFNTDRRIFMRLDAGFGGREGPRFFWKFGPAF